MRFDSRGEKNEAPAAFAARCSMSIPYFFPPTSVDGRLTYDGGIKNNFPLKQFIEDYPSAHFIGLYLGSPDHRIRLWSVSELLQIITEGDERSVVDKYRRDIVVIDPSPIATVDFSLAPIKKEFLLSVGKAAAMKFLLSRKLDNGPLESDVHAEEERAEELRRAVVSLRRLKRNLKMFIIVLVLAMMGVGYFAKSLM